ncbi:connector enhancer of kinase suppressor of ras 1-like [Protopterus annectens]|uniref:connector enhancer of kinase suppressor of ras 1-like n=1 Tax=Protopterus annectens TaxID=7888 RepID=UPI001CFB77E4|nr:connector enhancer of kinase suppressor of ras 1-like [Protopterus annectens]
MVGDFLSSETSISRKKSGHVRSHSNPFPFSGSIQKQEEIPRSPLTDQSLQSSDQTIAESPEMIPHQEQGIHVEKGFKSGTGLAISSPFLDSDSEPSTPVSPEVPQVDWERRTESCRSIKKPHSSDSTVMSQVTRRNKKKGSATKLSRRRISCCDLGEVDCDGWLWQKKDNPSFMAPKWRKGWFALKKNSLYWYTHPNDEKAEGFIDLSTYNIESAGLHKRKYVFKLCHAKFKTFFFAAENVDDLSKWVAAIVNAISKHAQHSKVVPSKEEDCYSESEVDDTDEEILSTTLIKIRSKSDSSVESQHSGSSGGDIIRNNPPNQKVTSGTANKETVSAKPQSADLPEDDMEKILKELHQGGVTLIGKPKSFTREHYRSSFIKRNKNPVINEKIHKIRTLKSTLKAKEVELQTIEKLLVNVKKETLSKWKEENQDLHREIMEWAKKLGTLKTGSVNPDPKQRLCPNEYSLTQSLYDNTVHAKNPVTVESSQHRHTEKSSDKMDTTPQAVVYNKPKAKKQVTLV